MRVVRQPLVLVTIALALVALLGAHRPAAADAKKDIEVKIKEAMESYDLFEYEESRKLLNTALTLAKKHKLEAQPIVARVHLSLGIVYYAGLKDEASAKLAFLSAVEIDPKIQIDPAYRSAEMAKLLDEARVEQTAPVEPPIPDGPAAVDCVTLTGLDHTIIDTGTRNAKKELDAYLGSDVTATKVVIKYRVKGQESFTEVPMTKQGDCKYVGAIPAKGMAGDLLHYYVAAIGADGREVASKGSEGSPNIIETVVAAAGTDNDNPLGGGTDTGPTDTGITGGVVAGGKKSTVFIAVAVGTGAGYVTGETEQAKNEVECCLAPALLHIAPEIGYFVNRQLAISLAGRIGIPLGANMDGHSPIAPAGLVKIRYVFAKKGTGIGVSGGLGGGIIRNTIKLTDPIMAGQDTDIVAIGPLLISAGAGYTAAIGKSLRFTAELNAIAGLPIVKEIGTAKMNFGVQFDLALGLGVGF